MSEPAEQSSPLVPARRAPSPLAIQGGGHDRFGPVANLTVYTAQALDLARQYADEYGLLGDFENDAEVTVLTVRLAVSRQREMLLLQSIEQELAEDAAAFGKAGGYAKALYLSSKRETHKTINEEVRRLHRDAAGFRKELKDLAKERREAQDREDASPSDRADEE